jgi:outer membrane receptor protein involved in Fe transport
MNWTDRITIRRCKTSGAGWQVLLLAALLSVTAGSARAQGQAAHERDEAVELEPIAVTGSRIKRAELQGPQPMLVIDQQEMAERGYTTLYEALADLTINNGYKFESTELAGGFTPDVQTINLRGFGVGTTLTLINGRRLANYPAPYQSHTTVFNFGSIPIAAIERVEILTSGASAIYGSDAVAGVVNIILRSDIDETTVNVLWGTPTETRSARNDIRLQFVNGRVFDRGGYTFTGEYLKRDSILGEHFDDFDDQQDDYPFGQGVYDRSIVTADMFRSAFGLSPYYRDPAETLGTDGETACSLSGGGRLYAHRPPNVGYFCADPGQGVAAINFQNGRESISLYFNGTLDVGDRGTELFTDLLYFDSESTKQNNNFGFQEEVLDLTRPDSVGFGFYDWYAVRRIFNEEELGVDLSLRYEDRAYTIVGGVRGTLRDQHDYEFSVNFSTYKYSSRTPALKWREMIDNLLGTWLGVSFFGRPWWSGGTLGEGLAFGIGDPENVFGPPNEAVHDTIGFSTYGNETENLFIQYVMSGDLLEMGAGPLSYALVAEYEDETLSFIPDQLLLQAPPTTDVNGAPVTGLSGSGWYLMTGYDGVGDRQRWSLGGELRIPLHETLTLNAAARYDDYDSTSTSYGGDVTPSASIEWRPVSGLLLRAGYTESFRAPDMAVVFVRASAYVGGFDYVSCYEQYVFVNGSDDGFDIGLCGFSPLFVQRVGAQDLGGEPLDAETGDSYWIGLSWDITDNLSITADYTHIKLEQRVQSPGVQNLLNDEWACYNGDAPTNIPCEMVEKQIIRGADPNTGLSFIEQVYGTAINWFEEEGSYIDVRVTYNLNTQYGAWRFQGDYNNVLNHTLKLTPESEAYNLKSDPLVGGWDFRSSFVGSVTWSFQDFSTTLTGIYRGSTTLRNCTTATNGCVGNVTGEDYLATENWWVDSYLTWNLTASYYWRDDFLTRIRVVNLTDEPPPLDDTHENFYAPWYNTFAYPGAGIGRYAALELQYSF